MALLLFGMLLLQEGVAQATDELHRSFFVRFPTDLLPLVYVAILILIPNFAVSFFIVLRKLPLRRWMWITTALSAVLLLIVCAKIGFGNVWGIIDPISAHSTFRN